MYTIFYTGSLIDNINDIIQVHTNECGPFNLLLYNVIEQYKLYYLQVSDGIVYIMNFGSCPT